MKDFGSFCGFEYWFCPFGECLRAGVFLVCFFFFFCFLSFCIFFFLERSVVRNVTRWSFFFLGFGSFCGFECWLFLLGIVFEVGFLLFFCLVEDSWRCAAEKIFFFFGCSLWRWKIRRRIFGNGMVGLVFEI